MNTHTKPEEPVSKPFVLVPPGTVLNVSNVPMKPPETKYRQAKDLSKPETESWLGKIEGKED
jgi:hypothetical protein